MNVYPTLSVINTDLDQMCRFSALMSLENMTTKDQVSTSISIVPN